MKIAISLAAALVGLAVLSGASAARAAGFDGKWQADIPAEGRCNYTSLMTLLVSGADIVGEVHNPNGVTHVKGLLDPDGTATFKVNGQYEGTMRFDADHFDATWNNGGCDRHASGDRAPDAAKAAALLAVRKQHQDLYADLVRRAQADDRTLDYTQLRTESVYAGTWEFYDTRVNGLLDQARASVKGKDCVQGLQTLDQLLKLDFVVDEAHALKADCLRQTGRADEARIEQDIADGLTHSLMDSSAGSHSLLRALTDGDGSQIDAAYVVTTYREEMEILAKRHIVLRTRQTVVHGADGHYYDLIKGVRIETTGFRDLYIDGKSLYFDVTSFVAGRTSQRAAASVAVASAQ